MAPRRQQSPSFVCTPVLAFHDIDKVCLSHRSDRSHVGVPRCPNTQSSQGSIAALYRVVMPAPRRLLTPAVERCEHCMTCEGSVGRPAAVPHVSWASSWPVQEAKAAVNCTCVLSTFISRKIGTKTTAVFAPALQRAMRRAARSVWAGTDDEIGRRAESSLLPLGSKGLEAARHLHLQALRQGICPLEGTQLLVQCGYQHPDEVQHVDVFQKLLLLLLEEVGVEQKGGTVTQKLMVAVMLQTAPRLATGWAGAKAEAESSLISSASRPLPWRHAARSNRPRQPLSRDATFSQRNRAVSGAPPPPPHFGTPPGTPLATDPLRFLTTGRRMHVSASPQACRQLMSDFRRMTVRMRHSCTAHFSLHGGALAGAWHGHPVNEYFASLQLDTVSPLPEAAERSLF